MSLIEEAEQFATQAHAGQLRQGGEPYIEHPRRVAACIMNEGWSEHAVAAAWLHDVLEDTDVRLETLLHLFPFDTCFMVHSLTDQFNSRNTLRRYTRKTLECARLRQCCPVVQTIKLYDRADNLRGFIGRPYTSFRDVYLRESEELLKKLTKATAASQEALIEVLCNWGP